MAYYYVKNGGTATGDAGRYTTQQTGSFASLGAAGYYNDINAAKAATTTPTAGDYILVSDLHSYSSPTATNFNGNYPARLFIIVVNDANIDQPRTSGNMASETTTGSVDPTFTNAYVSGFHVISSDNINFNSNSEISDCKLEVTGSDDRFLYMTSDGSGLKAHNVNFHSVSTEGGAYVHGGGRIDISHSTVTTDSAGMTGFFVGGFGAGGGTINITDSDLTGVANAIFYNSGADISADDIINISMSRCKMTAGASFTTEDFRSICQRLVASQCSDSDVTAEYQYHVHAVGGDLNEDTSVYRGEDTAFPISNQKISYEIITNTDASLGLPFWFDFPDVKGVDLSAGTGSDKISLSITSDTALTDKDIYMEVSYPDGTNYATSNTLTTAPTTVGGGFDILAAATTLTADTGSTWTGGKLNEYILTVDTSTNAGAKCAPSIRVYVTKPSTTLYISSEPQVS